MSCDLLTVFTRVGGGHKSAALAVCEAARDAGLSTESRDIFDLGPRLFGDAYLGWHLRTTSRRPQFYGAAYFGSNRRGGALEPLRLTIDRVVFRKLLDEVERISPRVIVATHHLPLVVLGRARRKGMLHVPVVGVVTDYTAHAVWAERGVDAFCTASALPTWELSMHGVSRDRIVRTGIPVRPRFERVPRVRDPLASEPLRVLVTSGGFGVGPLRAIVRSCAQVPNVALTVVCGASEELRAQVAQDLAGTNATPLVRGASPLEHPTSRTSPLRYEVLGFERDMPARVADAHVVVGKAGGLTVSETLTAGRAMIIVGAVPGNEELNERFVTGGRAGYACAAHEVGELLASMRARGDVAAMGARARALVMHGAAMRVLSVASALAPERRAA